MRMSDKLYDSAISLFQVADSLSLITDALQSDRDGVSNNPVLSPLFCARLETYFSGYSLMVNTIRDIASGLDDMAYSLPEEGG